MRILETIEANLEAEAETRARYWATLTEADLWAIVGARRPIGCSENACNELSRAKAELRRRGCCTVGL